MITKALAAVLLFILPACADTTPTKPLGTFTGNLTTTWNGNTRYYDQYMPATLAANPALWVMFHATIAGATLPTAFDRQELQQLAIANGFIVIWPKATYHAGSNSWFWDAYFLDYDFVPDPDDSGFVRSLILQYESSYPITNVFVTGMSSGGFMAHRVGIDSSDLVTAVGAAEAQLYSENIVNLVPNVTRPVSAIMFNGDADPRVGYCGQNDNWGNTVSPSSDVTADYWVVASGYTDPVPQLCTDGQPTPGVEGLLVQMPGVTVQFVRIDGGTHQWIAGTGALMWNFFQQTMQPARLGLEASRGY
jgi:polyhydroxybutyrate depolymerase